MQTLQEIENYLKEKQGKANTKLNDSKEKLNGVQKNVQNIEEQLQLAKQEGNTEKYLQLKDEKRKAIDVVEMYSDTKLSTNNEPLLTSEEHKQIKTSIHTIANNIGQKQLDEANNLVRQLKKISDEITNNYVKANELLRIANNGECVLSTEEYKGNKALWITKEINMLSNQVKYARGEK